MNQQIALSPNRGVPNVRGIFSQRSRYTVTQPRVATLRSSLLSGELKENANAQLLELLKRSRLVQTLQAMKGGSEHKKNMWGRTDGRTVVWEGKVGGEWGGVGR